MSEDARRFDENDSLPQFWLETGSLGLSLICQRCDTTLSKRTEVSMDFRELSSVVDAHACTPERATLVKEFIADHNSA